MKNILIILFLLIGQISPQFAQEHWLNNSEFNLYQGNYRQALEDLNNHIDAFPNQPSAYVKRARVYGILGEFTLQEQDLKRAQELNSLKTNLVLNKQARSNIAATKTFEYESNKAIFQKSPVRLADYRQSLSSYQLEDADIKVIGQILKSAVAYDVSLLQELISSEDFQDVPTYLKHDINGLYELKKGNLDKAELYFNQAIATHSSYAFAYHNLAIAHFLQGEIDQAMSEIKLAIELDQDLPLFYYSKARIIESIDPDKALTYYKKAIVLDQNYTEAKINYGVLLQSLGRFNEGFRVQNNSVDDLKLIPERKYIDGMLHLIDGQYETAISDYTDFLAFKPNDPDALFNRGISHLIMSNYGDGCKDLENSISQSSDEERLSVFNQLCVNTTAQWKNQ